MKSSGNGRGLGGERGIDLEEGEIDRPVCDMSEEAGERREVMVLVVLHDNYGIIPHERGVKDQGWNFGETGMVVRGIGENEVERLGSSFDKTEHITTQGSEYLIPEFLLNRTDESGLDSSLLDGDDAPCATRHELPADGSGAGEEVTDRQLLEINQIFEHVEDILAREVSGGSGGNILRDVETASAIFSSYYSQSLYF